VKSEYSGSVLKHVKSENSGTGGGYSKCKMNLKQRVIAGILAAG
jgi:hypothetical protein